MRKSRFVPKLLSILPALLMMIVIFWFSSQPADDSSEISISFSLNLIRSALFFFRRHLPEADLMMLAEQIHGLIRKIAHYSEYTFLSFFIYFPFYIYKKKELHHILYVILFCFLYACSDEIHQYFVPGRACRLFDICIDTSGAITAMLLVLICRFLFRNKHA